MRQLHPTRQRRRPIAGALLASAAALAVLAPAPSPASAAHARRATGSTCARSRRCGQAGHGPTRQTRSAAKRTTTAKAAKPARAVSPTSAAKSVKREAPSTGAHEAAKREREAARTEREAARSERETVRGEREASRGEAGGEPPKLGGGLGQEEGELLTDPIDPRFLTKVPFGASSFWLQPWRAYLDTWPASTLLNSVGINFNVGAGQAEAVAQLLQESGFKLARREIPWGALSYEDPTRFTDEARIEAILLALKRHDLRPLILLNANSGQPGPAKQIDLTTTAVAHPGAMTVRLSAASAAEVVPGKTGFDGLTWGTGPDVLITSVSPDGVATLSRPLRSTLPAGSHRAMTLRYAPFQNPKLPNGEANPVYGETMAGWLSYVATVNREAARIMGAGNYDLEVWNELSFGSQFLNYEHYYQPADSRTSEAEAQAEPQDQAQAPEDAETEESPQSRENSQAVEASEAEAEEEGEAAGRAAQGEEEASSEEGPERKDLTKAQIDNRLSGLIRQALLRETVAYVRDPANGIPASVGITDGFASQTPFPSGELAPRGLTALSKHLYNGARQFPAEYRESRVKPLNALGLRDTEDERGFKPLFVPDFQSLFPEYFLSAISTETLVRDIAPITTRVYGLEHGRDVGPAGGEPVQKWMTEYNLSPGRGHVVEPDGVTPAEATLTAADRAHFEAKALLRSLVADVNKGLSREYFFAAAPGALSLIGKSFYSALEASPETYPGAQLGGETMSGFREMLARFQGPGPEGQARQLKLVSIAQEGDHAQFAGDGTAAHPSLYDRDVLAVLPFQSSPTRFVIPVYVMTRDLLTLYEPWQPESDVRRFDLPDENFRIVLAGLPATSSAPSVSAYDPLRREDTPARLLSRHGETAEFEIAATDYPRLLTLEFG